MTAANGHSYRCLQKRVRGTNISAQTLLATDYLNHFNEIVMLLEMVADIPECLDDARAWAPKSYQDHFRDSGFSDKDLAVEAYRHVPAVFLVPFESTIRAMDSLVTVSLQRIEAAAGRGDDDALRRVISGACGGLHKLIDVAGAIINGHDAKLEQNEIDRLLAG